MTKPRLVTLISDNHVCIEEEFLEKEKEKEKPKTKIDASLTTLQVNYPVII